MNETLQRWEKGFQNTEQERWRRQEEVGGCVSHLGTERSNIQSVGHFDMKVEEDVTM